MLRMGHVRGACVVLTALTLGQPAHADRPTFFMAEVDRTFVSPFFSAACGFEVSITEVGTVKAKVHADATGNIVSEIDTQPGYRVTYGSNASGKAFSFPFATVFHFDFPFGAAPGSPAIVIATGLVDKVTGLPADAGRVTYGEATVLFVDSNGVPIVDFGAPTAFTGHANDFDAIVETGCAALAP